MMNIYANITVNACKGFISNEDEFTNCLCLDLYLAWSCTCIFLNHYKEVSISKDVQFSKNAQKSGHAYDVTDDAHFVMFIKCILSLISSYIPSPSSLMDLGSETAKHCIVSYFCCWGSCSCDSSWFSLCGLTSIRQLNVWLFLLGPSLDQGTPFTTEKKKECRWSLFSAASCKFYCN